MKLNLIGPFIVNSPFGTEIAFAKGLRRIGVEVIEIDPNIDETLFGMHIDANATVVFKSCVGHEEHLKRFNGPVIVYQPDDARFPHIREMMLMMRKYSDLFLSFDDHGATVARTMGYKAAETLLLTADDELYCPSPELIERDIDISFIGSLSDSVAHASRRKMCDAAKKYAEARGLHTVFGECTSLKAIIEVYRRSKIVLNHATDVGQAFGTGYGLQCRHFEVGMTHTCLLTNSFLGAQVMDVPTFTDEKSLLESLSLLLNSVKTREFAADRLHEDICGRHMPEHRATQMVDFIRRNA